MIRNAFSRADETRTADGGSIDHYPRFQLGYSFDERRRPSEVTIFDPDAGVSIMESWLTADIDTAVPVEECR